MHIINRLLVSTAALVLATGGVAHAKTWVGGTSGAANSWNTGGNWSPTGVPGSSDAVVLDGSISNTKLDMDANVDVASFVIQNNFTKDVAPTGSQTIRVRGVFTMSSTSSNNSFTASTVSTQIDGNITLSEGTLKPSTGSFRCLGNMTQSGGTMTGGTGTIQIDGNLSVTGGNFNATATSLIKVLGNLGPLSAGAYHAATTTWIGGAFNHSSASNTYDSNNGTLLFNATGSVSHTFTGATTSKVIFNDSLVGYWNLDEGSGTSIADASGYVNTGTLTNGPTFTTSVPSVAFADADGVTFDGVNDYATIGVTSMPAADAAQTISLWAKFSSAAGAAKAMVALTGPSAAVEVGLGGGNVRVWKSGATNLVTSSAASLNLGNWHHIAYTWDGTTNRLYVDGVVATSTTAHDGAVSPTAGFLGATAAATNLFAGSLDDVRIYNRALGAREITDLAFGRYPGTGIATHTISDAMATSDGNNIGHLVLLSGTIAGTGAVSIEGDWLNYGGRVTNTATITLNGGGSTRVIRAGGQTFGNLTIDSGTSYTLYERLWVTGTLNIASGGSTFTDGGYTIHAARFNASAAGSYTPSTGIVVLDGSSDYSLTPKQFCGLRIEDPTETNLVGYWKLDDGQGTGARDVSGSGNTGTLSSSGATWTAASTTIGFDNPTAISFDGSAGYVSLGVTNLPAANASQTISAWVNITSLPGSAASIVALTGSGSAVKLGLSSSNLRVLRNDGTALISTTAPSTGTWHHVAYTWDGTSNNLYVDGTAVTPTATSHDSAAVTGAFIGATSAAADFLSGKVDDVRVYSTALTAAQVAELAAGRYAGTGGLATLTLTADTNIPQTGGCNGALGLGFFMDSGNLYTSNVKLTVKSTALPGTVSSGTLHIGSDIVNFDGGLTVQANGTLLMDTASGQFQPGVNTVVTINGTLQASTTSAIIQRDNGGERYTFRVGTTATARPTINITGLAIRDLDADGLYINYNSSAVTTFTRFDNLVFTRGSTGTGTQYLQVYAPSLYLASDGCQFGVGENAAAIPASAVKLTGNGTSDGETRAIFGGASCATSKTSGGVCVTTWKTDDDGDFNGVGDTPASNGAVVQFVRAAESGLAGTVEGFPTAAFNWTTFAYYSTYVAYHDVSGTVDRIYVRGQDGNAKAGYATPYWDTPSGETIVGTPRWDTVGSTHYVYVALASGKVYRLIDNTTSGTLTQDNSGNWAGANNPFDCSCAIVTPLGQDTSNLYWGGTASGQKIWTLGKSSRAQPTGSPFSITPAITSAQPTLYTSGGVTYLFLGMTGHILKIDVTNQSLWGDNSSPGSASIYGRITLGRLAYAGDDAGKMWAIDIASGFGSAPLWSYSTGSAIRGSAWYDYVSNSVMFGNSAGNVYSLEGGSAVVGTGYPYTGLSGNAITSAPLYNTGVLVVGSSTGMLHFIDRSNGTTGPALIKQFYFGPTQVVSAIGYDSNASRYMVSVADATNKDGRLYYIDSSTVPDPTSGTQ